MIKIEKELFGKYKNSEIYKYKIKNTKNQFQVNVLNYGGIITEILVKDKNEKIQNVVLGYKSFEKYIKNPAYPGMIIGRTSGRIENGKIEIDGEVYNLYKNNGEHSLHGGNEGLNCKVFNEKILHNGVEFSYLSPHLEEGYPGNLLVKVKYKIEEDSTFVIEYEGESDKKTYINLTNHSYFNLAGNLEINGDEQILKIKSNNICELKKDLIPTGNILNVKTEENKIFDFNNGKKIKDDIEKNHSQFEITRAYDHPYILNWNEIKDEEQISLKSLHSGIKMSIFTTEKIAVVYTGNYLDEVEIFEDFYNEKNIKNKRFLGVAIETQDYPNGINEKKFESKILEPNEKYFSKTIYKFEVENNKN